MTNREWFAIIEFRNDNDSQLESLIENGVEAKMRLHQALPEIKYQIISIPDTLALELDLQTGDEIQFDQQKGIHSDQHYQPIDLQKASQIEVKVSQSAKTLGDLKPGETGKIARVEGKEVVRRRLLDMGFTQGTTIKVLKTAPLGDPIEFELRGYSLTLRKTEASQIFIQQEEA